MNTNSTNMLQVKEALKMDFSDTHKHKWEY
jgi:hypothetical protein